jgi:hypothetical protein
VTPEEILEALEIALPEAGVVAFQHGFDVWLRRRRRGRPGTLAEPQLAAAVSAPCSPRRAAARRPRRPASRLT